MILNRTVKKEGEDGWEGGRKREREKRNERKSKSKILRKFHLVENYNKKNFVTFEQRFEHN